ncbi:TetR family transcriptional regulator [Nocardia sp. NPDC005825]|uniref:TetR/AcrR family transcriptional regulator n=1 Tax=unclassified Nocardia TaxID=2637762 RepID=UPI0033E2B834
MRVQADSWSSSLPSTEVDDTDARILDAAVALFAELGISRVSPDDIARHAGINRATLYRRIGNKDEVVRAAMLRETTRVLAEITERVNRTDSFEERVTVGFATTVTTLRTNPVLVKMLTVDRDRTLADLTVHAGQILELATTFVLTEIINRPGAIGDATETEMLATMMVRLVHSLVLTPDAPPRLTSDNELQEFATRLLTLLTRPS